jgi:hypothetical protein
LPVFEGKVDTLKELLAGALDGSGALVFLSMPIALTDLVWRSPTHYTQPGTWFDKPPAERRDFAKEQHR